MQLRLSTARLPYTEYFHELQHSRFCLCAPGRAPWTKRIFEAIVAGCVPVIFDDDLVALPFSDIMRYDRFVVRVPSRMADRTLDILAKISDTKLQEMQQVGHLRQSLCQRCRSFCDD